MSADNDNDKTVKHVLAGDVLGRGELGEAVTDIDSFEAPYGQAIRLQGIAHDSGLNMLRLNIRERRRFTIFDIDARTARHWAKLMTDWADSVEEQ